MRFRRNALAYHPNGMTFAALNADGAFLDAATYYSVGGGFVVDETASGADRIIEDNTALPYPFDSGEELLVQCQTHGMSISQIMLENEQAWRSEAEIRAELLRIWHVMQDCVHRGVTSEGILPGGMKVKRRASELYRKLTERPESNLQDPLSVMDWVNVYAIAVNEENAWGGRVVTAPTNGAAGIIPAVLHYYAALRARRQRRRHRVFLVDCRRDRHALQEECLDLRRRRRLSGRGGRGLFHGRGGSCRGARRHA